MIYTSKIFGINPTVDKFPKYYQTVAVLPVADEN